MGHPNASPNENWIWLHRGQTQALERAGIDWPGWFGNLDDPVLGQRVPAEDSAHLTVRSEKLQDTEEESGQEKSKGSMLRMRSRM